MNPGITIQKCYVILLPAGEENVPQCYNECTNLTNGMPRLIIQPTVFTTDFSNRPICWTSFNRLKFLMCSYCLRWIVYLNASVLYSYRLNVCLVIYKVFICIGYIYAFVLKNIKTTEKLRLFFYHWAVSKLTILLQICKLVLLPKNLRQCVVHMYEDWSTSEASQKWINLDLALC